MFASASSATAWESRPRCCEHGNAATGCSTRCAAPEAFACTGRRTSAGCERCRRCWQPACQRGRRPKRCSPHRPETCPHLRPPIPGRAVDGIEDKRSRLTQTLARFDDVGANAVLDRLLADVGVTTVISEVIVPYLVDLGERWADGSATIAEEHFATSLIRGRLLGLARGWDGGSGPRALLACPSGELHDLGLICFGIALRGHGWRITYLGADTPQSTLIEAAAQLTPNIIVLAATRSSRLRALAGETRTATVPIAVAGKRGDAHGSPTSSVPRSSTSIRSPPLLGSRRTYGESLARSRRLARGSMGPAGLDRDRRQVLRVPLRVRRSGNVDHDRMVDPRQGQSRRAGADRHRDHRAAWRRSETGCWNARSSRWCSSVSTTSPTWRCLQAWSRRPALAAC